jgi:hypothetical protein
MDQGFIFVKGEEIQFDLPSGQEIICQAILGRASEDNTRT